MVTSTPYPGSIVQIRSAIWKVLDTGYESHGSVVRCRGMTGITKDKEARFVWEYETDTRILDPGSIELVADESSGLIDTKLYLEAALRSTPTTTRQPLTLGLAAIDDLAFQHSPVTTALAQDRVRLLIADDVGLGKTLEAGLVASELILRGRANRILVVTTRAMMVQFQREFWTRFSIPLARLDGPAIQRMRNRIPAHYNVFDQFDRAIVSIDTLKKDGQIRAAIQKSRWDLVIIDEAHHAADRGSTTGRTALRAKLAMLLAERADSLLLLTATPHDGSARSFASLIRLLDPTRVHDPENLRRADIEDLVVRRFRSSPDVQAALRQSLHERELLLSEFTLSAEEEVAYKAIADLELDLDRQGPRKRAIDLFRTTLAKAIFSSPAACLETLKGRVGRIRNGQASGTEKDIAALEHLTALVGVIDEERFTKYQELRRLLASIKWTPKNSRDRLVIFSERIKTCSWLVARLKADFRLTDDQVVRIDGGSVEAERETQLKLEDFGQEKSPIRILVCSDMASEGLNLHFQCHRLIHFDLPWSLLRFQQRNGRIDRYGQDRTPYIYYFVARTTHEKVRQMWVFEKLVEKDKEAQSGVGDPAVFLGVGDPDKEEAVVAEAVNSGQGADAFEAEMDSRAEAAEMTVDDEFDALFGDFHGVDEGTEHRSDSVPPPRLFADTFDYCSGMLRRLGSPSEGIFKASPDIDTESRAIGFSLPDDMLAPSSLGYSKTGEVDERYMPPEAVGFGNRVELTDKAQHINRAIDLAKMEKSPWPRMQFLWDSHPLLEWFSHRADSFFPGHRAPVAPLNGSGRLEAGEVSVVLHAALPNANGAPVLERWAVLTRKASGQWKTEELASFLVRVRLSESTPNSGVSITDSVREAVVSAVDRFQTELVDLRRKKEKEIREDLSELNERLDGRMNRFLEKLERELPAGTGAAQKSSLKERQKNERRIKRENEIESIFDAQMKWFERSQQFVDDPNPHVDVKAVFVG